MREGRLILLRLRRFKMIQRNKIELLEKLLVEFEKMAADLAEQVAAEEKRTRNNDTGHFGYSTFAKAAALRRRNLMNSVADLDSRLDVAKCELDEMTIQLRDLEFVVQNPTRRSTHSLGEVEKHIT